MKIAPSSLVSTFSTQLHTLRSLRHALCLPRSIDFNHSAAHLTGVAPGDGTGVGHRDRTGALEGAKKASCAACGMLHKIVKRFYNWYDNDDEIKQYLK